jgi:hypothetical protein
MSFLKNSECHCFLVRSFGIYSESAGTEISGVVSNFLELMPMTVDY